MATKRKVDEALRDYFRGQQAKLEADANKAVDDANETNRTLLNQLFVMAAGIITLSSPLFIDKSILGSLPPCARQVLSGTVMAAAISILAGFTQLYSERRYFQKSKTQKFNVASQVGRGKIKSVKRFYEVLDKAESRFGQFSPDSFTDIQFISLGVASLGYITVITYIFLTAR